MTRSIYWLSGSVAVVFATSWGCSSSSPVAPDASADAGGQDSPVDTRAESRADGSADASDASSTDSASDVANLPDVHPDTSISDAATPDPEPICSHPSPGFNEDAPGYYMSVTFGTSMLMGSPIAMAVATFMQTAREDYCNPAPQLDIPIGSCTTASQPGQLPQCVADGGVGDAGTCSPEQQCVPETNDQGQPIAGTEHCATPRQLLDVGPFTMSGFTDGDEEFGYNSSQQGAYTSPSTGDGTIQITSLNFDHDYTFSGDGVSEAGANIGHFQGSFHFPADFQITYPPLVQLPSGFSAFQISTAQDMILTWTGGDPNATLSISISSGVSGSLPITCAAANNGAFAIPAALLAQVQFSPYPMLNSIDIRLQGTGTASGQGLTLAEVVLTQTFTANLQVTQ